MKKILIIGMVLVTIALTWLFLSKDKVIAESPAERLAAVTTETETQKNLVNKQQETNAKTVAITRTELPEDQLFHENRVIDTMAGMLFFAPCLTYYSDDAEDQKTIENLTDEQEKYLNQFFESCETDKAQFKNYTKSKIRNRLMQAGQEFKALKDSYSQNFNLVQEKMKVSKGIDLLLAVAVYQDYFFDIIYPELMSQLSIKDHNLLVFIVEQAMFAQACESGLDCSYVSGVMMKKCMDDEKACGLSYNEYLTNEYPTGLQQEIMLTKKFLYMHFGW
jgi:hypothetical protein